MPPRRHAIIIWTLQRTGGTSLGQCLAEQTRHSHIEQASLKLDLSSGEPVARWQDDPDSVALAECLREVCEQTDIIKHCVETAPWAVTQALAKASCSAGFKHLFLYRKQAAARLLSLHVARTSGIWSPPSSPGQAPDALYDKPLPVKELIAHERLCAQRLQDVWELLLTLDQYPLTVAFEDIYGNSEVTDAEAKLASLFSRLELEDPRGLASRFAADILTKAPQGNRDRYQSFQGVEQLERGLAQVRPFIPAPQFEQWEIRRADHESAWSRYVALDASDLLRPRRTPAPLAGLVVTTPKAPQNAHLLLSQANHETPIPWGFSSQWAQQTFPNAPNADHARFTLKDASLDGPARLDLVDPAAGSRQTVAHLSPRRPSRDAVVAAAMRVAKTPSASVKSPPELIRYQGLRRELDALGCAPNDLEWLQASVLLDARFQQAADKTLEQVSVLRQALEAQGDGRSEPFLAELRRVLGDMTLGPHGYTTALAGRNATDVWSGIRWLMGRLERLGLRCFINSGTLLGAIREGRLIAHDDDVDLAVILEADNAQQAATAWVTLKNQLAEAKLLDLAFDREVRSHAKIGHAGGASVDLFPAWIEGDRVFVWPYAAGETAAATLLPLRPLSIGGVEVQVPNDPQTLLALNYGPDWKKPDPSFRFDWALARSRFMPFLDSIKDMSRTTTP